MVSSRSRVRGEDKIAKRHVPVFTTAGALDILVQLLPEVVFQLRTKVRRVEEDGMRELALSDDRVVVSSRMEGHTTEREGGKGKGKGSKKTQASARDQIIKVLPRGANERVSLTRKNMMWFPSLPCSCLPCLARPSLPSRNASSRTVGMGARAREKRAVARSGPD